MHKKLSKLCIGPMSLEVIDAICSYANKNDVRLMLIASRNQIECDELGRGYVNNFSTDEYVKYIKGKDKKQLVSICRDHTGPFLSDKEKSKSFQDSLDKTKLSIKKDIQAGFDLLHIDTSLCKNKYETAEELIEFSKQTATENSKKIFFEFGTEEHGVEIALSQFKKDIQFASKYPEIKFVVGQTGSLCKEIYQVGSFDFSMTKKMVDFSKKHKILLKEHNGDYLSTMDLNLRKNANLGSLNVAPQFGVEQTKTIFHLSNIYEEGSLLKKFQKKVLEAKKWKKWVYGDSTNHIKFLCSGHYFFSTNQYRELVFKLDKKVDTNRVIKKNIQNLISHYYNNL